MAYTLGWAVSANQYSDIKNEDGTLLVSMSCVRPFVEQTNGTDTVSDTIGKMRWDGRGPKHDSPDLPPTDLQFFYPWLWMNVTWVLWIKNGSTWEAGPELEIVPGTAALKEECVDAVEAAMKEEIKEKVENCPYPFSGASDDAYAKREDSLKNAISLVHGLGPLSQLVPPLSMHVFKQSVFLSVPEIDAEDEVLVVAVPRFNADGHRFDAEEGGVVESIGDDLCAVTYPGAEDGENRHVFCIEPFRADKNATSKAPSLKAKTAEDAEALKALNIGLREFGDWMLPAKIMGDAVRSRLTNIRSGDTSPLRDPAKITDEDAEKQETKRKAAKKAKEKQARWLVACRKAWKDGWRIIEQRNSDSHVSAFMADAAITSEIDDMEAALNSEDETMDHVDVDVLTTIGNWNVESVYSVIAELPRLELTVESRRSLLELSVRFTGNGWTVDSDWTSTDQVPRPYDHVIYSALTDEETEELVGDGSSLYSLFDLKGWSAGDSEALIKSIEDADSNAVRHTFANTRELVNDVQQALPKTDPSGRVDDRDGTDALVRALDKFRVDDSRDHVAVSLLLSSLNMKVQSYLPERQSALRESLSALRETLLSYVDIPTQTQVRRFAIGNMVDDGAGNDLERFRWVRNTVAKTVPTNSADEGSDDKPWYVKALSVDEDAFVEAYRDADPGDRPTLAAAIGDRIKGINGLSDEAVEQSTAKAFREYCRAIQRERHTAKKIVDEGLDIPIWSIEDNQSVEDHSLRGVAIALRAELDDHVEPANWITDAEVAFVEKGQNGNASDSKRWLLLAEPNDEADTVHTAIGSATVAASESQGEAIVEILFTGTPVCAAAGLGQREADNVEYVRSTQKVSGEDIDRDQTACLDYVWTEETEDGDGYNGVGELPLLGFGLMYRDGQALVDHAGLVLTPSARDETFPAQLRKPADVVKLNPEARQYLSHRRPDSPTLMISDSTDAKHFYGVSKETNMWRTLEERGENSAAIGFIVPQIRNGEESVADPMYEQRSASTEATYRLRPPQAPMPFVEQWLNTDAVACAARKTNYLSNDFFQTKSREDILTLRRAARETYADVADAPNKRWNELKMAYDPSIARFGLEVQWWKNGKPIDKDFSKEIPNKGIDKDLTLATPDDASVSVVVKSADRNELLPDQSSGITVLCAPGVCVELRAVSLVDTAFVQNRDPSNRKPGARLDRRCFEGDSEHEEYKGYYAIAGLPSYVECGPAGDTFPGRLSEPILAIDPPTNLVPNRSTLRLRSDVNIDASWYSALHIERHNWHWTGHPVAFQGTDDSLPKNILAFADVGSYRDTRLVELKNNFDEVNNNAWEVTKDQIIDSQRYRDGSRPSGYLAYAARPLLRFRSRLNSKDDRVLDAEKQRLAIGRVIGGIRPRNRLPEPVHRFSLPLSESYRGSSDKSSLPERTGNGCMLVFDEEIMRTDDQAAYGGIGEYIDVDLVDARPFAPRLKGKEGEDVYLKQMGPNPIFAEQPDRDTLDKVDIEAELPFGLTYDLGRNAKVNQSCVVLFPRGLGGKWGLAKVRTRRIIWPEYFVEYDNNQTKEKKEWLRKEGRDLVPTDMAVDVESSATVSAITIDEQALTLPKLPKGDHRLTITWHKDRWGSALPPHWRPAVTIWERGRSGRWEKGENATPYVQPTTWLFPKPDEDGRSDDSTKGFTAATIGDQFDIGVKTTNGSKGIRINRLEVSDYTDPQWISFIGTFENESLGGAMEFELKSGIGELLLRQSDKGIDLMPVVRNREELFQSKGGERVLRTTFHLLLMFEPTNSVMHDDQPEGLGKHIGTLEPETRDREGITFKIIDGQIPKEGRGFLISFQVPSSLNASEKKRIEDANSWQEILDVVFPPIDESKGLNQIEALARPLPEIIGPITLSLEGVDTDKIADSSKQSVA
ncbi:MAG: hypothetical protein AAF465_07755 [Pseudomonadota bacterium]